MLEAKELWRKEKAPQESGNVKKIAGSLAERAELVPLRPR